MRIAACIAGRHTRTIGVRLLDLFSGIGGLSLGFERAGFRTVAFCEIDWRCRNVLAFHWPGVPVYLDARSMPSVEADVVAGGPPCQRTSVAAAIHGKRTGETLWPAMRSILARSGAARAVVEQPPGNEAWEEAVQGDLEADGFGVSRHIIAACDVGGVNPRRRVFMVADRDRQRLSLAREFIASALERFERGAPAGNHWSPDNARAVRVVDGVPGGLDRAARIKQCGNAIVPQVAEVIGRAIMSADACRGDVEQS
jgi:DNA (cytosine-5)-methyltransferase 1